MLISFLSAKGSPGVSTTVLALASRWPAPAVVVEADPMGGDMLAGVGGAAVPATRTVLDLVVAARQTGVAAALPGQLVRPGAHCPPLLAGVGSPAHAAAVPWGQLGAELARLPGRHVLADCGRYVPGNGIVELLRRSQLVVLVLRSALPAVRAAARLVPLLDGELDAAGGPPVVGVLIDPGRPYGVAEIEQACGLSIVGALPADPRTARVWSDGHPTGRMFTRSPLQRAAAELATAVLDAAADPSQGSRAATLRGGGGRLAAVRPAGQLMRGAT
jgi:MinD-like ATPase involved in chromosome partitioning or flagellar assembly